VPLDVRVVDLRFALNQFAPDRNQFGDKVGVFLRQPCLGLGDFIAQLLDGGADRLGVF
jgi:hypothetical protein